MLAQYQHTDMSLRTTIDHMLSPDNPNNIIKHYDICKIVCGIIVIIGGLVLLTFFGSLSFYGFELTAGKTNSDTPMGLIIFIGFNIGILFAVLIPTYALVSWILKEFFLWLCGNGFFFGDLCGSTFIRLDNNQEEKTNQHPDQPQDQPREESKLTTRELVYTIFIGIYYIISYPLGAAITYGFLVATKTPHPENYIKLSFTYGIYTMFLVPLGFLILLAIICVVCYIVRLSIDCVLSYRLAIAIGKSIATTTAGDGSEPVQSIDDNDIKIIPLDVQVNDASSD